MCSRFNPKRQIPIRDYEKLSDEELFLLLEEEMPALAEMVKEVSDTNRETVIAFLKVFLSETK